MLRNLMNRLPIVICAALLFTTMPLRAEDTAGSTDEIPPTFGGPDSVGTTVEDDTAEKRPIFETGFLDGYHVWKEDLAEQRGLSYGVDYSSVFLAATASLDRDNASGGMLRVYGSWDAIGRESGDTGTLVWKAEHRHAYGSLAPSGFGFELGSVGLFSPPFSDQGTRLTNLYWRQRFQNGRVAVVGGFLDPTDYVDVYVLASPWTGFSNFAFSTGTTTISLPNDALLGVAAGAMITDRLYLIGGFGDANSDPTQPVDGFDTLFNDHELFKHVEFGWTSSQDRIYLDNLHITLWHVDERDKAMVPEDWGINLSYSRSVNERWMPFVRAGWADEAVSLMEKSVSVGFGFTPPPGRDQLGIGINWGQPADSFGAGLGDQYAMEAFYRLQLSDETAITPNVQLLVDPALNPNEHSIWVFGLRVRIAL
jgi:porin